MELTALHTHVMCTGDLSGKLAQTERKFQELMDKSLKMEQLRRKMHNQIQELKGNIRVVTRVRPSLAHDGVGAVQSPLQCGADGSSLKLVVPEGANYDFAFDQVFGQKASQEVCVCERSLLLFIHLF